MPTDAAPRHPRRAARLRLAVADGQGGAARQPARPARDGRRGASRASSATRTSVLPAIENAILAGHDLVFLGERGQAKTRMARLLVGLLDEWLPVVRGGELNDDPYRARSAPAARAIVERDGDATADRLAAARPALRREAGDAGHHHRRPHRRGRSDQGRRGPLPVRRADPPLRPDPARQPRHRGDQRAARPRRADPGRPAQHPRGARRPDPRLHGPPAARPVRRGLAPTRRTTPRRGRIITPLKDRLGSQIRTHYPRTLDARDGDRPPGEAPLRRRRRTIPAVVVPGVHGGARRRADPPGPPLPGDQPALGRVSVRVSVANIEVLEAAALKRAVRLGERVGRAARVRPGRGRRLDRRQGRARVGRRRGARGAHRRAAHHQGRATRRSAGTSTSTTSSPVVEAFEDGFVVETGDGTPSREYVAWVREVPGLREAVGEPRRVRRHRWRRGAGGRRLGGRVPARGPPPRPAAQQGPGRGTVYHR